ncbi:MAG: hypothetical protein GX605_06605, partial [Chloroflexi bacterium]|nr:hypothetical protein [Chloroflexota bacterium]
RILRLASEASARPERRRISVLCIDAAPNAFLALEMAGRGGGLARFLTSEPDQDDIATALDRVLEDWGQPVLANLRLVAGHPGLLTADRQPLPPPQTGWSAADLGDLPSGRTLWTAGRVPAARGGLALQVLDGEGRLVAESRLAAADADHPGVKALFGARRILGLEFLMGAGYGRQQLADQLRRLGYDPDAALAIPSGQPPKVYAENLRADAQAALRDLLVQESLAYGLASAEAAFVAVRKERGQPVKGTVAVANALPSGWSDGFLTRQFSGLAPQVRGPMPRMAAPMALADAMVQNVAAGLSPAMPHGPTEEPDRAHLPTVVFVGKPAFRAGEAVLFDASRGEDDKKLPASGTLTRLQIRFPQGDPAPGEVDVDLALGIFVDDLTSPRAWVRLADLVRQGGQRPLHIRRLAGQWVRIVLLDPNGTWAAKAPPLELSVAWQP